MLYGLRVQNRGDVRNKRLASVRSHTLVKRFNPVFITDFVAMVTTTYAVAEAT